MRMVLAELAEDEGSGEGEGRTVVHSATELIVRGSTGPAAAE
jgi:hypothetical protein